MKRTETVARGPVPCRTSPSFLARAVDGLRGFHMPIRGCVTE